jgi:tetratricopeptide (TPR) repeat protein
VHRRLVLLGFLLAIIIPLSCPADEIELKNGVLIQADLIQEQGNEVIYRIGASSYRIPKASVSRIIRRDDFPLASSRSAPMQITIAEPKANEWSKPASIGITDTQTARRPRRNSVAITPPSSNGSANESALIEQVITDHRVDDDALAQIEKQKVPATAALANLVAAKCQMEQGDVAKAPSYVEKALTFAPQRPVLYGWYPTALAKAGRLEEAAVAARDYAERSPRSAEAFALLGSIYYNLDKTKEAVDAWKRTLELDPDAPVKRLLDRAQNDLEKEQSFNEQQSTHFSIRYEGRKVAVDLQHQIIAALELAYNDLVKEFEFSLGRPVPVILYGNKTFFDVTQAPAWAGALNDGRVRVPVEGIESVTPMLVRVLRHELVHSFLTEMTQGRCTAWLQEGLAQLLEPRTALSEQEALSAFFNKNGVVHLEVLEQGFGNLNSRQAKLAYVESLLAVEYLRSQYGMKKLMSILDGIAHGQSTQDALKSSTRLDYKQLENNMVPFLTGEDETAATLH